MTSAGCRTALSPLAAGMRRGGAGGPAPGPSDSLRRLGGARRGPGGGRGRRELRPRRPSQRRDAAGARPAGRVQGQKEAGQEEARCRRWRRGSAGGRCAGRRARWCAGSEWGRSWGRGRPGQRWAFGVITRDPCPPWSINRGGLTTRVAAGSAGLAALAPARAFLLAALHRRPSRFARRSRRSGRAASESARLAGASRAGPQEALEDRPDGGAGGVRPAWRPRFGPVGALAAINAIVLWAFRSGGAAGA